MNTDDRIRMSSDQCLGHSRVSLEDSLRRAKQAAADCILTCSWTFTVPGVILSVPTSVYFRSYAPLVFTACSASGLDYFRGLQKCKHMTDEVKRLQRQLALLSIDRAASDP